jgi:hypothetical protein
MRKDEKPLAREPFHDGVRDDVGVQSPFQEKRRPTRIVQHVRAHTLRAETRNADAGTAVRDGEPFRERHGRFEYGGVTIYNVSVVNEQYRLAYPPTVIDIDDW